MALTLMAAGCSSDDDESPPAAAPTEAPAPEPEPTPAPTPAPLVALTKFGEFPVGVMTLELGEEPGQQPLSV